MVNEARFRPAISADAYVDAPNRALLIGSYSPGQSAEKAAARRRSRRFILRLRRERTVELSQRHPSIGVLSPPAVGVFCSTTDMRRSIGRHRGKKVYWSAQRPPKGVARSAAAAAVNGGEGTTEAARGWVGPGAPRGVALRLQSAGPGDGERGAATATANTVAWIYFKNGSKEG